MSLLAGRRRRGRSDEGAYAILYGVTMVVLILLAALVVDISTMRADRRTERAAADSAALAGAYSLALGTGSNPQAACVAAVKMAAANLGASAVDPTAYCNAMPTGTTTCPDTPLDGFPVDDYTVYVRWAVPNADDLLTHPDNRPAVVTQNVFPTTDGTLDGTACGRLAVSVEKESQFLFAGILNRDGTSHSQQGHTMSTSVAFGAAVSKQTEVAALNVLEWHACDALQAKGQGSVKILAVTDSAGVVHPGTIAVESDGHPSGVGSSCPASAPYVVDPQNNPNNFIDAQGAGGSHTGLIQGYALNPSPVGNPPKQSDTSLPLSVLGPKVSLLTNRFYAQPVSDKYGCFATAPSSNATCGATSCPSCKPFDSAAPIPRLVSALDSDNPVPYAGAQAPYDSAVFQTLTDDNTSRTDALKTFSCNPSGNFYVPPGNWYVDCAGTTGNQGFQVGSSRTVVFGGGTVVFRGKVDVSGCLAVNVPTFGATATAGGTVTCPTVSTSTLTASPDTTKDALVMVRAGRWFQVANGSRTILPRTVVVLRDTSNATADAGTVNLSGGLLPILWTAPLATDCGSSASCQYARLQKIMLWSESSNPQTIGGQATMLFKGVLFTPRSPFEYAGQGTQSAPYSAQFWAARLVSNGQGTLVMAPDPKDTIGRPVASVTLIR